MGHETVANLPDHPKLKAFLDHCTRQQTHFFSIKKCGKADCTTCLPPCLLSDVFYCFLSLTRSNPQSYK